MKKYLKKLKNRNFLITFLILIFAIPTVVGMIGPGFYSLHDGMHVAWLYEMDRALRSGQIPPRWAPDLSFNFGYPLFNFVYPLPFYLGEFFYLFGFSLVGSIKAVFALSLILSGLSMFLFLRRNFSTFFSFFGAIIYLYTPYRAVDVYVRGAIGEALAFVFIPLVFWSFNKLIKDGGVRNLFLAAASFAFLVLSHNITFLMIVPFLIFYCAILIYLERKKKKPALNFVFGFLLGSLFSSYFWLPALLEKKFMVADTVFNFKDHFPFIKQLIIPFWGYGGSIPGPNDGFSFQIGLVNILIILLATACFIWLFVRRNLVKETLALFVWGFSSLLVVLFLMNIRSSFVWEKIPILAYFQFPWRFLTLTTFLTAFFAAMLGKLFLFKGKKIVTVILLVLTLFLTFNYFRPEKILPERNDDYFMNIYFATKTKDGYRNFISSEYLGNTEEYLRLPIGTEKKPTFSPDKKIEIKEGVLNYKEESVVDYKGVFFSENPTEIFIHNYYFPGWIASVDGKELKIGVNKPYGDMILYVPKGNHEFSVKFKETNLRILADLISVLSLTLIVYLLSLNFLKKKTLLR
jgi:hypothetical protein